MVSTPVLRSQDSVTQKFDILSRFLRRAKLPSTSKKPQNISLVRQKNTEKVIVIREGTRMVKDGED